MSAFEIDMSNKSEYNLSFLVDVGKTNWFQNGEKQGKDFINESLKEKLPKNTLFNINSLIFNIESHQEEILSKYDCYYNSNNNSFCIIIGDNAKYSDFSKEIMMNLMDFSQKLSISSINLLICRKNKDYVKLLQGMLTVGFTNDDVAKTTQIDGKNYKILKMSLSKAQAEIEEVDFM
jgi:hypothetical protein